MIHTDLFQSKAIFRPRKQQPCQQSRFIAWSTPLTRNPQVSNILCQPSKQSLPSNLPTIRATDLDNTLPLSHLSASLCEYQTPLTCRSSIEKLLKIIKRNLKAVGERSFRFIVSSVSSGIRCLPVCRISPLCLSSKFSSRFACLDISLHKSGWHTFALLDCVYVYVLSFVSNCALDAMRSVSCPLEQICNAPSSMEPMSKSDALWNHWARLWGCALDQLCTEWAMLNLTRMSQTEIYAWMVRASAWSCSF